MHHIHHTHGFILSSRNVGEASKMLAIYTREKGLLRARVQSIRLHPSKLRFALQDLSYAKIDLVRGKEVWRVTSASHITSFPHARSLRESIFLIQRISRLIERLCDGEEPHEAIFDDFIQALYLLDDPSLTLSSREALELHLVLRILNTLGYIGDSDMVASHLSSSFNEEQVQNLLQARKSIIAHINKALNESQL
jgi:DNA repair protein RecO